MSQFSFFAGNKDNVSLMWYTFEFRFIYVWRSKDLWQIAPLQPHFNMESGNDVHLYKLAATEYFVKK